MLNQSNIQSVEEVCQLLLLILNKQHINLVDTNKNVKIFINLGEHSIIIPKKHIIPSLFEILKNIVLLKRKYEQLLFQPNLDVPQKKFNQLQQRNILSFSINRVNNVKKIQQCIINSPINVNKPKSIDKVPNYDIQRQVNLSERDTKLSIKLSNVSNSFQILSIHNDNISCLLELSDKRIASCSWDKSIKISTLNTEKHEWKCNINYCNAHDDLITSICEIKANYLVSSSYDLRLKLWEITKKSLKHVLTLNEHQSFVLKALVINNNTIASCETGENILIWKLNDNCRSYQSTKLQCKGTCTGAFIKLKEKPILICGEELDSSLQKKFKCVYNSLLSFWDFTTNSKVKELNGIGAEGRNGILELTNNRIASVFKNEILIINLDNYRILYKIADKYFYTTIQLNLITLYNEKTFLFSFKDKLFQYHIDNKIKIFEREMTFDFGECNVLLVNQNKYMVIGTKNKGIAALTIQKN